MQALLRIGPLDIVLALRLTEPGGTLTDLAAELNVVPSQVHAALRRLGSATLLRPGARSTNARALLEFLTHGIRFVFPVARGALASGVPTAYSAPPLSSDVDAIDVLVWPAPLHPAAVQGFSIAPLYRNAHTLIDRSPRTYQLLAIADAFRLGDASVRASARARLEQSLAVSA
jgi:hypothetical protein